MTHQERIQELLEQRELLFEIAAILYGDDFIMSDPFWGSPTDVDLTRTHIQLYDLGYDFNISEATLDAAKEVAKEMGLLPDEDEDED